MEDYKPLVCEVKQNIFPEEAPDCNLRGALFRSGDLKECKQISCVDHVRTHVWPHIEKYGRGDWPGPIEWEKKLFSIEKKYSKNMTKKMMCSQM